MGSINPVQNLPPPGQPSDSPKTPYQPGSIANVTTFKFSGVEPPSPIYIQRDDQLVISAKSSQAGESVIINARLLLAPFEQGGQPENSAPGAEKLSRIIEYGVIQPVTRQIDLPTAFTAGFLQVPLSEGYLLSLSVNPVNATNRGVTFVRGVLQRGAPSLALSNAYVTLFGDYVVNTGPQGWPNGRAIYPTEGPGNLRSIVVTPPAAGAEWAQTVPTGARWAIRSVDMALVTAVAVANRTPALRIQDSGVRTLFVSGNNNTQAASLTQRYAYGYSAGPSQANATDFYAPLPDGMYLNGGCTLGSVTANLQAADQYGPITLYIEEWVDNF